MMTESVVLDGPGAGERLCTHEEVAAWLAVEPAELTRLNALGTGPLCYWVGRHRRYVLAEVLTWLRTTPIGTHVDRYTMVTGIPTTTNRTDGAA